MPRVFKSLILILSTVAVSLGCAADQSTGQIRELNLKADDELIISGPVELHLAYDDASRIEVISGQWQFERQGKKVFLTANAPTMVMIQAPCLEKLAMADGQLFITVQGNERMYLPEVSAPEVRLQLLGQARFDSAQVTADHLLVAMSEQGKASLDRVQADLLELELRDHGDLNLAGKATRQQVELSGYSHYDGTELDSEDATVALSDYSAGLIKAKNSPVVSAAPFASLSF